MKDPVNADTLGVEEKTDEVRWGEVRSFWPGSWTMREGSPAWWELRPETEAVAMSATTTSEFTPWMATQEGQSAHIRTVYQDILCCWERTCLDVCSVGKAHTTDPGAGDAYF